VAVKREKPHWGARKIRELLVRRLPGDVGGPAKSTIHAVLHRHGLVAGRPRRRVEMKCSADVYIPSRKPYSGLPYLTYPFHDRDILVTACGRICIYRKKINLSTALAGQRAGIKEVDDGIWIVSFMRYDLGYIDLEARTLQPLDNPLGPRLSPMS
jgi:hypothetical protein